MQSYLRGQKFATLIQHSYNLTCTHCLSAQAIYQRFDSWPEAFIYFNFCIFLSQFGIENNSTTKAFFGGLKNESKLFAVGS